MYHHKRNTRSDKVIPTSGEQRIPMPDLKDHRHRTEKATEGVAVPGQVGRFCSEGLDDPVHAFLKELCVHVWPCHQPGQQNRSTLQRPMQPNKTDRGKVGRHARRVTGMTRGDSTLTSLHLSVAAMYCFAIT